MGTKIYENKTEVQNRIYESASISSWDGRIFHTEIKVAGHKSIYCQHRLPEDEFVLTADGAQAYVEVHMTPTQAKDLYQYLGGELEARQEKKIRDLENELAKAKAELASKE